MTGAELSQEAILTPGAHLYKYVSGEVLELVLITRRLRWSAPELFDDPFDVPESWDLGSNFADVQRCIGNTLADLIETESPSLSDFRPEVVELVKHFRTQSTQLRDRTINDLRSLQWNPPEVLRANFNSLRHDMETLRRRSRILCLSARRDNEQMWSNYANDYAGAVLRFDPSKFPLGDFAAAHPVSYVNDDVILGRADFWARQSLINQDQAKQNLIAEFLFSKKSHWRHQQEWRVVRVLPAETPERFVDVPFPSPSLREVYLGPRMPTSQRETVEELNRHGLDHVSITRASIDKSASRISFGRTLDANDQPVA